MPSRRWPLSLQSRNNDSFFNVIVFEGRRQAAFCFFAGGSPPVGFSGVISPVAGAGDTHSTDVAVHFGGFDITPRHGIDTQAGPDLCRALR